MDKVYIWHNARCGKSRQALTLLQENNIEVKVVKYLDKDLTFDEMKDIVKKLGFHAKELLRDGEDDYKKLNLKGETDEDIIIQAMVDYPKLIQRAIVIKGDKAVLGRPPEKVLELFN
jgi:arsenate reductase (glutaredoxin)